MLTDLYDSIVKILYVFLEIFFPKPLQKISKPKEIDLSHFNTEDQIIIIELIKLFGAENAETNSTSAIQGQIMFYVYDYGKYYRAIHFVSARSILPRTLHMFDRPTGRASEEHHHEYLQIHSLEELDYELLIKISKWFHGKQNENF